MTTPNHTPASFQTGGEMGERIRALDWSKTSLGAADTWPVNMRAAVAMMLRSKMQIVFFCGPEFTVIYNDAYRPVFGAKHPTALGLPGREAWAEIWESLLHALLQEVVDSGEAYEAKDLLFPIERYGFLEETYFDICYDPVVDDAGGVIGVYCIVTETTGRVVGERRLATLRDLASRGGAARTAHEACEVSMRTLAENPNDIAVAMVSLDHGLQASSIDQATVAAPSGDEGVVELSLPRSAHRAPGKLVVKINPKRPLDDQFRSFLDLVASQISIAINNADASETEMRRADALTEAELRVSEEKYRSLFNSIDEGFCVLEIIFNGAGTPVDLRFIEVNDAFSRQSGLQGVVGKLTSEVAPGLERVWVDTYAGVALTGEVARFEEESPALGRWFDVYASRVGGEGSARVAVVFREISERKRREVLSELLDQVSADLALITAPDEIIQRVGARVGQQLQISACLFADVNDGSGEVTVNYGWVRGDVPSLKRTFKLSDFLTEEFQQLGRAGNVITVSDTSNDPLTRADEYKRLEVGAFLVVPFHWQGKWTAYVAVTNREPRVWKADEVSVLREISNRLFSRVERARAEEALRTSEAQLTQDLKDTEQLQAVSRLLIADESSDELYERILDAAMAIMDAEFGCIQLLNDEQNELQLLAWRNFTPGAAAFCTRVSIETGSVSGSALRRGERAIVADVRAEDSGVDQSNQHWYAECGIRSVVSTPLTTRKGRVVGMISVHWSLVHSPSQRELQLLDVVARQAADFFERRRTEDALKESSRRKDEFLATLAHELRNPLAPIRSGVEVLRMIGTSEQANIVNVIDRQTTHLIRLVDDLMEVSRITRGKIDLRLEVVDLRHILRAAVETADPFLTASNTTFASEMPAEPVFVYADPVRLGQVFTNLLNNAAKYTDEGGRIVVVLDRSDRGATVHVRDTGTGIPADMLPRVFDLFTQVDRTLGRAQGGLGIGLALVKSLVESHGGSVDVRSDGPGKGSEFLVHLPIATLAKSVTPAQSGAGVRTAHQPLVNRRVLLVDDNKDVVDTMAVLLRQLGANVATAYGGEEALELVGTHDPSIMFVDLGMPGIDGYTVAQRVRSDATHDNVTLVALTGWGQEQDVRRARDAGFDHHLTKPANVSRVLELVGKAR